MALTLSPAPFFVALDDSGVTIPGALIETYASGSSTPLATYTDADGDTPNDNPVECDAAGRCTMYLLPTAYKFIYTTAAGVPIRTIDPVGSVPQTSVDLDIQGVAGEALTAGNAVYLSDGSGGLTAGRWYKTDADNTYSSSNARALGFAVEDIASAATGAIRQGGRVTGLSGLTAGTVYYVSATAGAITSTPPTNQRSMGIADTTTSLVITFIPPPASATVSGVVTTGAQTFAGVKTFTAAPQFDAQPTGIGQVLYSRCDTTLTKNGSAAFSNVSGMAFSVVANGVYSFEFYVFWSSDDVADIKFTLTGPAAPTGLLFGMASNHTAVASATSFGTSIIADGDVAVIEQGWLISGLLRNGANAGTVQLQMAQNTSNATDTKVYLDSYVKAIRHS